MAKTLLSLVVAVTILFVHSCSFPATERVERESDVCASFNARQNLTTGLIVLNSVRT